MYVTYYRRYDYEDKEFGEYLSGLDEIVVYIGAGNPAMLWKFLRYLPGDIFNYHKVCIIIICDIHLLVRPQWLLYITQTNKFSSLSIMCLYFYFPYESLFASLC